MEKPNHNGGKSRLNQSGTTRLFSSLTIGSAMLALYDLVAVNLSYFLALWFRFDCRFTDIDGPYLAAWARFVPIYSLVCLATFMVLKLYRSVWRFASYTELARGMAASGITAVLHVVLITVLYHRMPISYYLIGPILQFILVVGARFSYRFLLLLESGRGGNDEGGRVKRIMLIGAGSAGQMILRDTKKSDKVRDIIVCIIDDDVRKWGREIDGIPIGGRPGRHPLERGKVSGGHHLCGHSLRGTGGAAGCAEYL